MTDTGSTQRVRIREAVEHDGEDVREFVFRILADYGIPPDPIESDADVMRFGEPNEQGIIDLVAECDGVVIGSAILTPLADREVKLSKLFVVPEHRRRGVGRALLERAIEAARAHGHDRIEINTRAVYREAVELYERSGWIRGPDKAGAGANRVYYLLLR